MIRRNNQKERKRSAVLVSPKIRDYGNEPFVIKKADESKEFLDKHGFPAALEKRWPKG